ncbi:MAG: NAD(+) synthase [Synergistaceae bacterium]|nr:NAD(+) synthase [Synergistaceae bacterium]
MYVRVAAAAPPIRVADCAYNAGQCEALMQRAAQKRVDLLCLPELCITGYTCGDLFLQSALIDEARSALARLVEASRALPGLTVVAGLPFSTNGRLFNVAAVFGSGALFGVVPKANIPNYGEFYERRWFDPCASRVLFHSEDDAFCLAAEICEDLWVPVQPSAFHAAAGANIIVNPSASDELIGKAEYRRALVAAQSARLVCAYVYAGAGRGESSTDMVFGGHCLVCENGAVLAEAPPFGDAWAEADVDVDALTHDRRRMNTFNPPNEGSAEGNGYTHIRIPPPERAVRPPLRSTDPYPFVPKDEREKGERCEAILDMQASGLATRLERSGAQRALIGVSGGLDSCLALLVSVRAMDRLSRPASDVVAVTMPCFGTTQRTRSNAEKLCSALGVEFREINVTEPVEAHLRSLGRSSKAKGKENADVVYENAQARVRTLTLMDLANDLGGIVVGTGDLSELALGWATYNGDHMSMYGVNAGVPKTLVRHIVRHVADGVGSPLSEVLGDILATPVSPELLPPSEDGEILQRTEDIVGPYELHDFFLYHMVRRGRSPMAIYDLALSAWGGLYEPDVIMKWLKVFYRRFFAQQFKRSCLPDGPKVGSVSLSPRGDWRMPSDASSEAWLRDLDGASRPA